MWSIDNHLSLSSSEFSSLDCADHRIYFDINWIYRTKFSQYFCLPFADNLLLTALESAKRQIDALCENDFFIKLVI